MKLRYKLIIILAVGHIGLVALGAAGVNLFPNMDGKAPLVEWYRHLSGADNSFEYFAPGVGPQERVTFNITDKRGRQWPDNLQLAQNHEANLSFGTIPFVLSSVDDETAWNMMRSMADAMFRRHPSAVTVQVRVDTYAIARPTGKSEQPVIDFPTMRQYRNGERPEWLLLYGLTFSRSGEVAGLNESKGGTEL